MPDVSIGDFTWRTLCDMCLEERPSHTELRSFEGIIICYMCVKNMKDRLENEKRTSM